MLFWMHLDLEKRLGPLVLTAVDDEYVSISEDPLRRLAAQLEMSGLKLSTSRWRFLNILNMQSY